MNGATATEFMKRLGRTMEAAMRKMEERKRHDPQGKPIGRSKLRNEPEGRHSLFFSL
jgi:hypothetical protein